MKLTSRLILKLLGWKIQGNVPNINKYVAVSAPHTSNMDFILGALYYLSKGIKAHFLIKKELFFFPLGTLLKTLGGIPVDRKNSKNIVENMVKLFKINEEFYLIITPEGTRKKNANWKGGFYYIAKEANVPVMLSYFDYKKKIIALFEPYYLKGSLNVEMKKIKLFFKDVTPRHPEKFTIGNI
ncbi:MAG: 1-acyl-sn-glycerol-3-phosphate acyltransferase [Bacteroidales bacterium]|nr:1-acyl-sn-glycerol-3-phosphate acyltransferase [Bacteroidales bacterium]